MEKMATTTAVVGGRKVRKQVAALEQSYQAIKEQVAFLNAQLKARDAELFHTKERMQLLHTAAKAFFYAAGST